MSSQFFESLINRQSPLIIAEIGANYGGINTVKQMVRSAAECGADMVKFQTYQAETIAQPECYFTMEDGSQISQYDFFKKNELSSTDHDELQALCHEISIPWCSTPSHLTDLDFLERFDLPCYKTGSDDLTNTQFLKRIAERGKPMLVSTGMCTIGEIESAVEAIFSTGNRQLILLHCVVSYPSRIEDANLRVIESLKKAFGVPVGLSDHTEDEFTSILATQLGAVIIEKHFTLDHALNLPDHEASLDPVAFKRLVKQVRMVPFALGDGVKRIQDTEEKWRKAARKSLFASVDINIGTTITEEHISVRRPSHGIHPKYLSIIAGRQARLFIPAGTLIQWNMV